MPRPPPRSRFLANLMGYFNQAKAPKDKVKFIGQDHLGNMYYEAERPNHQSRKVHRYFEKKVKPNENVDPTDLVHVPPPWSAWLRFTRQEAPSIEKVQESEEYYKYQQANANAKKETGLHDAKDKSKFPKLPYDGIGNM